MDLVCFRILRVFVLYGFILFACGDCCLFGVWDFVGCFAIWICLRDVGLSCAFEF